MTRRHALRALALSGAMPLIARQNYSGPRPPQKDLPYLLEAGKLIPTEVQQAKSSSSSEGNTFSVSGATSTARTPLPEPIFLFASDKVQPDQLGLYHFKVEGGHRQVTIPKRRSADDEDFRITVRKLDAGLYRIEAAEMLDPGEYSLSPQGANTVFCFTVY